MENHRIDRFFQDKLVKHEIDPSPQAWEAINAELKRDKKPMIWLKVAAVVTVLAVVAALIFQNKSGEVHPNELTYVQPNSPAPLPAFAWEIPALPEKIEIPAEQKIQKKVSKQEQVAQKVDEVKIEQITEQLLATLEMPEISAPIGVEVAQVSEAEEPVNESIVERSMTGSIQMTYTAAAPAVVDDKRKIEKLWAFAKEIKPGEVLASIRDTKDDFLNGKRN